MLMCVYYAWTLFVDLKLKWEDIAFMMCILFVRIEPELELKNKAMLSWLYSTKMVMLNERK